MKLQLIDIPPIKRVDTPAGRFYETPGGGFYPSVSTVIAAGSDHTLIDEWRGRVGEEVANKISKKATDRGTLLHENIENYLRGKAQTFTMWDTEEQMMFKTVIPFLKKIEKVFALETQLWSDKLRVAGTVDCGAVISDRNKLIDWKTSGRYKTRNEIHGYFMQSAAYAWMIYERTGILISDIVIVMMTQDDGLLIFEEKVYEWLPKFIELRNSVFQ